MATLPASIMQHRFLHGDALEMMREPFSPLAVQSGAAAVVAWTGFFAAVHGVPFDNGSADFARPDFWG